MKKYYLFFLVAFFLVFSARSEDIIYNVKAIHNSNSIALDSILVENLYSGKQLLFKDIPASEEYQINITKGTIQGVGTSVDNIYSKDKNSPVTLVQNSRGAMMLNYNANKSGNFSLQVSNLVGQLVFSTPINLEPESSLRLTLPGDNVYIVNLISQGYRSSFKGMGSKDFSSFDITSTGGLLPVQSYDDYSLTRAFAYRQAAADVTDGDDDFLEGDEIMVFAFSENYHIESEIYFLEGDEFVELEAKLLSEAYTNTAIDMDFEGVGEDISDLDLSGYKLVSYDESIEVDLSQQNSEMMRSKSYTEGVQYSGAEMSMLKGAGFQLINLVNQHGVILMSGLFDLSWEESEKFALSVETTALVNLCLHPFFISSSSGVIQMLQNQFKTLPSFDGYKNKVGQAISNKIKHPNDSEIDFINLDGYMSVVREYVEKYKLDNNLSTGSVDVYFSDIDSKRNVQYKVVNKGKRTLHIYANRNYLDDDNLPSRKPVVVEKQIDTGDLFLNKFISEHMKFIRLGSDKLNYWSTVWGTFYKGWIEGEMPDYIYKSETNQIKIDLEDANRLELEIWGLGKSDKPLKQFTDEEKEKLVLVALDAAFHDFASPVIELISGLKTDIPDPGDGKWDFRYGTRKHAISLLLFKMQADFFADPVNWLKLENNATRGNYVGVVSDLSQFVINNVITGIQEDIANPNSREAKYLNVLYNSFKQATGVSKTSDWFRAQFVKGGANQLLRRISLATKTISILESSIDIASATYYSFFNGAEMKDVRTKTYKTMLLDTYNVQIMPGYSEEINILGDGASASYSIQIDDPEICAVEIVENGRKLIITGLKNGSTEISIEDNLYNSKTKLSVTCLNQTYLNLELDQNFINMPVNKDAVITVTKGSPKIKAAALQSLYATVRVEGYKIIISPRSLATIGSVFSVFVTDEITKQTQVVVVTVGGVIPEERFAVSLSTLPGEGGSVNGAGAYKKGATVRIEAKPNYGYKFVSWMGDISVLNDAKQSSASFIMPDDNITLAAVFEKPNDEIEYSLTLNASPQSAGTVTGAGSFKSGETVSISAQAATDYEFVNWTGDVDVLTNPNSVTATFAMPEKDVSLTANFKKKEDAGGDGSFTDSRDGNVYKTVKIGEQVWMAENLKYLPTVNRPGSGSETEPYYYVYDYNGTDVEAAKATENYNIYGVLYNWAATIAGDESSDSNPSDVQGVCPDGWHLPSDAEWTVLENYLIANGYNYDGTTTGNKIAIAMAKPGLWANYSRDGTIGNGASYPAYRNKSGFSALPGGSRNSYGGYKSINAEGYWWSSTANNTGGANLRHLFYGSINLSRRGFYNEVGISVRCVRDDGYHEVSLNVSPEKSGTVTGAGRYKVGETVSISAQAVAGYKFVNWTGDVDVLSDSNSATATFNMPDKKISLTANYKIVYGNFTDSRDGNVYKTVQIGNQVWMAENLKYLPEVSGPEEGSGTEPYYYVYDYNGTDVSAAKATQNYQTYGVLYNWAAARLVCPEGWHLPSNAEWGQLQGYVGNPGKLKHTDYWLIPNTGATNESGFSAFPGGSRGIDGFFDGISYFGHWWSFTQNTAAASYKYSLRYLDTYMHSFHYNKEFGFSVRCVKD